MLTVPTADPNQELTYSKNRLLAASGVVALCCFVLLVYPARHVEAKKTFIDIEVSELDYESDLAELESLLADENDAADIAENATDPNTSVHTVEVKKGNTLSSIFSQLNLSHSLLVKILDQDKQARQFTNLKIGQKLIFTLDADNQLIELKSNLDSLNSIHLKRNDSDLSYTFSKHTKKTTIEEKYTSGTITKSFLAATKEAGLPYKLTIDFGNIFGYDIDFAQDLRKGDSFEVIYEQKKVDGKVVSSGNILAARFVNKGKAYTAIRYTNKQGYSSYYDANGTSTQKAFIRTPVDFTRISSKFSLGRKHPVLNKIRAHKGVDYAAPTGTPVKATGDGKVIVAAARGGYGNTVIIQHGPKYRTVYAHLRNFAKGVRSGSQVKQGQIIAYVGTSGLSTGPHLHYEFQVNGVHVDPLSHTLPAADPIPKAELATFKKQATPLLAKLEQEKNILALARD